MRLGLSNELAQFAVVEGTWPPIAYIPKRRKYIGIHHDMQFENTWNDIMKTFEETRYA